MTKQYIELGRKILDEGEIVFNERTGKNCLVLIDANLTYDVGKGEFPLPTTRDSNWVGAIAELIGYLRGWDDAEKFEALGTKSWNANSTAPVWLHSPFRLQAHQHKRHGTQTFDYPAPKFMGRCYGPQLRDWRIPEIFQDKTGYVKNDSIDQLRKVYNNLKKGIDDRGEILMMWNPGEEHMGCLRPCMFGYQFSLVNGKLYLHATQRSCDVPLGLNYNQVQVFTLLAVMAKITGHTPAKAFHKIVNAHVYEDQLELFKEHMKREPSTEIPRLILPDNLNTLEDVETWLSPNDFKVENYVPQDPIKYPFSV